MSVRHPETPTAPSPLSVIEMRLDRQDYRVYGAAGVALVVALALFGILNSEGAYDTGPLKIGGPVVGWVVVFVLMMRYFGSPTPEAIAKSKDLPLVVDEILKFLDLHDAPPTDGEQRVQVSDYYRTRRTVENAHLNLPYATSGDAIEFVASRPDTATFKPGPPHVGAEDKMYPKSYKLELDLTQEPEGATIPIVTHLTYVNAFQGIDGDSAESHIYYPTERLAFLAMMPDSYRCTSASGTRQIAHAGPVTSVNPPPVILQDGGLVYWVIENPLLSASYLLKWNWKPRQ